MQEPPWWAGGGAGRGGRAAPFFSPSSRLLQALKGHTAVKRNNYFFIFGRNPLLLLLGVLSVVCGWLLVRDRENGGRANDGCYTYVRKCLALMVRRKHARIDFRLRRTGGFL